MVNQDRNCLGDITNQLPKTKHRRPTKRSGNPLQGKENRTPLADISHHFPKHKPRTKKLSDEEKMDYLLQFYCLPLVQGKIQGISQFLREKNIEENSNAIRRDWRESGLKDLKSKKNPVTLATARKHYIHWMDRRKKERAIKNKKNLYGKNKTCDTKEILAEIEIDDSEHCNKKRLDENEREESIGNGTGKAII